MTLTPGGGIMKTITVQIHGQHNDSQKRKIQEAITNSALSNPIRVETFLTSCDVYGKPGFGSSSYLIILGDNKGELLQLIRDLVAVKINVDTYCLVTDGVFFASEMR